jgi:hypothetical protein
MGDTGSMLEASSAEETAGRLVQRSGSERRTVRPSGNWVHGRLQHAGGVVDMSVNGSADADRMMPPLNKAGSRADHGSKPPLSTT